MSIGQTYYRATDTGHGIKAWTHTPTRVKRTKVPTVTARTVHPDAVAAALALAGGDPARLEFNADGSVTVTNGRRRA